MRGVCRVSTAANDTMAERVPLIVPLTVAKRTAAGVAIVSTSVFHVPQDGHWPCHLGADAPHSVQV